jgi:proline iminopeptidase
MPIPKLRGTEIFYTLHGDGPPVVVMHGGLGLDHTYFRPWLDPLGKKRTLVYYDHRGNGRSARPASLDDVDHATWADDADALRAALGHEKIVLFGHSYGSFLALEYALRHADRLAGLVLVGCAPKFDYTDVVMGNAAQRATPEQLAALQGGLSAPAADDAAYARIWRSIAPLYFHRFDAAVWQRMDEATRYSAAAFNAGMFRCLPAFDVLSRLAGIRVPTLVVTGRHDWITPVEQGGARIQRSMPDAKLVVFEESGHYPFIEEPARFLDVVGGWLDERRWSAP